MTSATARPRSAGTERYEFALHLRHLHLFSDDDRVWFDAFGQPLDEAERLALLIARHEGDVDNLHLRSLTGHRAADTTKTLVALRDRGLLDMTGWGRGASYRLRAQRSEAAPDSSGTGPAAGLGPSDGSLGHNGPSAGTNEASLGTKRPSLGNNVPSPHAPQLTLPRRLPPRVLEDAIVDFCSAAWRSRHDIQAATGRGTDRIRDVVAALVRNGRLVYEFPEQPNHPRQRYRATQRESDPRSDA